VLIEQYRILERAMLEHLEFEEAAILPDYAVAHPADAAAIRDDHAAIRNLLFHMGVEVELHVIRLDTLLHLLDTLRAHAAREETAMYPWAQVHLPLSTRRRLFVRLGRSLRKLAELRAPLTAAGPADAPGAR